MTRAVALGGLLLSAVCQGATLRAIGVLGNSGEAGESLLRVGGPPLASGASGVAVDRDLALWVSGGDRINRVGLDGRLVESFALEPKGSAVDSRTLAVLGEALYFLGHTRKGQTALFALPMRAGAVARPLRVPLPERKRRHVAYCLAPQPLGDELLLATEPKDAAGERIGVYRIDPKRNTLRRAFALDGSYPHGIAVDRRRGVIYVGANFGSFVGGITHSHVYAITCVRPDGRLVSKDFPAPCTKTPATPTQFRGLISLAGGALWDTAWYGFLARLDLVGRGAPGRIVQWHHELDYPSQVLGVLDALAAGRPPRGRRGPVPLVISTRAPDAFYFAAWDRGTRELRLVRRIGCLPTVASLGLTPDGRVTVGTARAQLWWRWEDAADCPPRKAGLHVALTPQVHHGERCFAVAAQYRLSNAGKQPLMATQFSSRPGNRNEAQRVGEAPMKRPVGLALHLPPGKGDGTVLVTDAATKQLWRIGFSLPALRPHGKAWKPVRLAGLALDAPTDVAALTDGRLLVADGGRLVMLAPEGAAYRPAWQWSRWGDGAHERFGPRLRFALDGPWLLVADVERHRLLWVDWARREVLAQLGETDEPGDDPRHLTRPTLVSLRGTRAVVADAGNQRVLKVALEP